MGQWKEQYIALFVLDGMEWELSYNIKGNKKTIYGCNSYPFNWKKVDNIIKEVVEQYVFGKIVEE